MSDGTVVQRLMNMQNELLSIEAQCNRERQVVWPLVWIMHELDEAVVEYSAKAYKGECIPPEPKPEWGEVL
jgi:hypothetical protein